MRKLLLFIFVSAASVNVMAQAKAQADQASNGSQNESTREQRRVELRSVLQFYRNQDRQETGELAPASRHLTPQERAEMRRQLRQHQSERSSRP